MLRLTSAFPFTIDKPYKLLLSILVVPISYLAASEFLLLFYGIDNLLLHSLPSALHGVIMQFLVLIGLILIILDHFKTCAVTTIIAFLIAIGDLFAAWSSHDTFYQDAVKTLLHLDHSSSVHMPVTSAIAYAMLCFPMLYQLYKKTPVTPVILYMTGSLVVVVGAAPYISAIAYQSEGIGGGMFLHSTSRTPINLILMGCGIYLTGGIMMRPLVTGGAYKSTLFYYSLLFFINIFVFYAVEINSVIENRKDTEHTANLFAKTLSERTDYISVLMLSEIQSLLLLSDGDLSGTRMTELGKTRSFLGSANILLANSSSGKRPNSVESIFTESNYVDKKRINNRVQAYLAVGNGTLTVVVSGLDKSLREELWAYYQINTKPLKAEFFEHEGSGKIKFKLVNSPPTWSINPVEVRFSAFDKPLYLDAKLVKGSRHEPSKFSLVFLIFTCTLMHLAMSYMYNNISRNSLKGYLELIKESSTVGLITIDNKGRITDCNEAACALLQIVRPDNEESFFTDFLPSGIDIHAREYTSLPIELNIEGTLIPIVLSSVETTFEGSDTKIITLIDKRTEVKIQREIEEKKDELEMILGSLSEGVIEVDRIGTIVYANQAAEDLIRINRVLLVGMPFNEILSFGSSESSNRSISESFIFETLNTGAFKSKQNQSLRRKDGSSMPVKISSSAIVREGNVDGAVIVFSDNSEAIESARMQRAHVERMAELNENLTTFTHIVTHDFQQPARTIATFASLAIEHFQAHEYDEVGEMLPHIETGAARLYAYIGALLDYLKSGPEELTLKPTEAAGAINHGIEALDQVIKSSGSIIEISLIPKVLAVIDPLASVFQNLISNAINYVKPGVTPRISIWGESNGKGKVNIYVQDNGIGIAEEDRELVFEPSKRLVSTDDYEGSGMGLSIAARLVEKMHGSISIMSSSDAGTTFKLTLLSADINSGDFK